MISQASQNCSASAESSSIPTKKSAQPANLSGGLQGATHENRTKQLTDALTAQLTDVKAAKRVIETIAKEHCPELIVKRRVSLGLEGVLKFAKPLLAAAAISSDTEFIKVCGVMAILALEMLTNWVNQKKAETQQKITTKLWEPILTTIATQASGLQFKDRREQSIQYALEGNRNDWGQGAQAFINSIFAQHSAACILVSSFIGMFASAFIEMKEPAWSAKSLGYNLIAAAIVATGALLTWNNEKARQKLNKKKEQDMAGHNSKVSQSLQSMCDPKTADQLEVAVQKKFPEEHMKKNVAAMCNEYLKFLTETFKLDRKSLWFTSGATLGAAFFLLYNWCTGAVSTSTITGFAFAAVQLQGTICSLIANGTTIHEAAMKVNKSLRLVENWKEVSNNYGLAPRSFTPEEVADWKNRLKGKKIDFILSDIVVSSPEDPKNTILQINGSLTIQAGSLVGIVGESGAGKTTFVNVLLGILKPTSGDVRIALSESRGQSYSLSEIPLEALHNEIGYNEQGGYAGRGVTVDKYVGLGANDHDDSRKLTVAEALEQANVTFLNGKEPADVTIGLGGREFSGGEQSRLRVAQVLYGNRPIFILDEPHTGLDNFNKQSILDNIFKENRTRKTRLYISHDLSGFDRCDQIIVIQGGKPVLSGTPEEMKLKSTHYQELIESANKYPVPSILKTAPRDPLCQLVLPGFDC